MHISNDTNSGTELADSEFRTIIDDARARHTAVVALIYATDSQAIGLLRLYVTLGVATASGTAAGIGPAEFVSRPVTWALGTAMVSFVVGAGFCLSALRSTRINLPGRKADFWLWAIKHKVDRHAVLIAYLETLAKKGELNAKLNANAANALKWAKRSGVVAPIIALAAAAVSIHWGV